MHGLGISATTLLCHIEPIDQVKKERQMLTKEQRRAAVKAAADRVMPGIAAALVADAAIAKAKGEGTMKCPNCGKRIGLEKSMLGGKRTAWHKPPKSSKATTFAEGHCLFSGQVL